MKGIEPTVAGFTLKTSIQYLKGVGPDRAALFERLGIRTVSDLIFYFPRDYQDMSEVLEFDQLKHGQTVSVRGVVREIDARVAASGRHMLGALIENQGQFLRAVWFNQPYMRGRLFDGQQVLLSGQVKLNGLRWEMHHPRLQPLGDSGTDVQGEILPVYPVTEGLKQTHVRRAVEAALESCVEMIPEAFPSELLDRYQLWPIHAALPQIHFPSDQLSLREARRRFVFQELFLLQLAVALRRSANQLRSAAPALPINAQIDSRIRRLFSFEFTGDQEQAIQEIVHDTERQVPMNRLLHGDVGTGKTAVAIYLLLLCVSHGYQAAMMSPTEILARQHEEMLSKLLRQARARIGLLVGSLTAKERRDVLGRLEAGEIDILIGTQALIQRDVPFKRLGVVVIDEQHRFGVQQRASLRNLDTSPHYLVMSATPIPRTVAMTVFGDLDVSLLRETPSGRAEVHTYLIDQGLEDRWWEFYRKKLREGRQGYVIAPLVDDSDEKLAAVEAQFETLCNDQLADFRVDFVHGRLAGADKAAAMQSFRSGRTQVLVATSVVEVGVDVPNATQMTIYNAERFGLAQLHQLRGRVSRGTHAGFVGVFADLHGDDARKRLDAFTQTNDGFRLAEIDFTIRGPGDLFGNRQHGLPPMRIANLIDDRPILEEAREFARQLVEQDPLLERPEYAKLRRMVIQRFKSVFNLADVG